MGGLREHWGAEQGWGLRASWGTGSWMRVSGALLGWECSFGGSLGGTEDQGEGCQLREPPWVKGRAGGLGEALLSGSQCP